MGGCSINKGNAAALSRYSSAVCLPGVRCTSAVDMWVLAFMTMLPFLGLWFPEAGSFISTDIEEIAITRHFAVVVLSMSPRLA